MAEQLPNPCERLTINRRKLLATAAGIGAAGLVPNVAPSEAVAIDSAKTLSNTYAPIPNVCATTARRLVDIERRNLLRKESGLPLLSVTQEYRRLKNLQAAQGLAMFSERFRGRGQDKVLAKIRRQTDDPNWKPYGAFQGMALQNEVSGRLGRLDERIG